MTSSGMHRRSGGGGGGFDPSNLHLKKELTQIRKAARVLRDPETTSSWRSPVNSARSAAAKHYYRHSGKQPIGAGYRDSGNNGNVIPGPFDINVTSSSNGNGKEKGRKKVYLYNWKMQRSESERSRQCDDDKKNNISNQDADVEVEESSSSSREEGSLSDARNNGGCGGIEIDSKSDNYASMIFKCKDTNFTPPIRRHAKKKSRKSTNQSSATFMNNVEKMKEQIMLASGANRSLDDQSDDTTEYSHSEDLRRGNAISPLLAKLKNSDKNWTSTSLQLLKTSRKEDSLYSYGTHTPAMSTSSYNRYAARYPSTAGSWDATTLSLNDGDNEVDDDQLDFPGSRGCGIPCYWSRRSTPKYKGGSSSCFSPSFSDTLRRTGNTILCGSHRMYKRSHPGSSFGHKKRRAGKRAVGQGLIPLLRDSGDGRIGSSLGTGNSDDELSTNYGELDLEALSRLDGKRWSTSYRSQEGLELVTARGDEEQGTPDSTKSLSQKYRPMFFDELIGQNIVVQSLMSAVSKNRIAPVYLFQGPRGTGKTSTARVFAAALNCLCSEETKPCGVCRDCTDFISGKSRDIIEVDGANKKDIQSIRYILKSLLAGSLSAFSRYKVFIINECHLLPAKTWKTLLKFLEDPPQYVVLMLITTDLDNMPRTVLSRCQKYLFNKLRDIDIVARLRKIASEENLAVESDALDLIAMNADGSLRDAETMLDQLSLLGKRITGSLVNELVGVVSDEKLLDLLELAMSSDTAETVRRARELMDSGVDPMVLMSQMATIIMDIIAGTYRFSDAKYDSSFFGGRNLTEAELNRLKRALKLLSESEKQLRVTSERSTWFTATLLQLGSMSSPDRTHSGSSRRQSSKATEEDPSSTLRDSSAENRKLAAQYALRMSGGSPTSFSKSANRRSHSNIGFSPSPNQKMTKLDVSFDGVLSGGGSTSRRMATEILDDIWMKCIEKCPFKALNQLLHAYGKLVSISEAEGIFVAYIAFEDSDIKTRAEGYISSITNSFETVLRSIVEVRIILLPDGDDELSQAQQAKVENAELSSNATDDRSNPDTYQESIKISRGSFNDSEDKVVATKQGKPEVSVHRIESIIREQKLETAWLQAMDKGTPGSTGRVRPEKNQILPQEHVLLESANPADLSSLQWEDDLGRNMKSLMIDDSKNTKKEQMGKRVDRYPMSPSLLHDNFNKDNMGYESAPGAGCGGLLCWSSNRPPRRPKMQKGTPVRSRKGARFSLFGACAKSPRTNSSFRR